MNHHNHNRSNKKRTRRPRSNSHGSASSSSSVSSQSDGEGQPQHHSPNPRKNTHHNNYDRNNASNANGNKCRRRKRKHQRHKSEKTQLPLPEESKFVALDCEMIGIGEDGHTSAIARVTVVDWDGKVLLDEYIKQEEPVTDYRTFVSGISPEDLEDATLSLEDCRKMVLELLQDHILVGHALKNDLRALDISHPWWLTRDTAKFEPFMKVRFADGILWPRKLKELVSEKLHQEIQIDGKPHSPYEDALAALHLYQSVRPKWESVMAYKIDKTNQIRLQHHQPLLAQ